MVWSRVLGQCQKNFALFGQLKPVVGPRLIINSPAPYNAITCILLITLEFQIFVGKVSIEGCVREMSHCLTSENQTTLLVDPAQGVPTIAYLARLNFLF